MPRGCRKAYGAAELIRSKNAKTHVFSDSVPSVRKMRDDPVATCKSKFKLYSGNNHFKDMNRIDGMMTEFEWKIFAGITTLGLLKKIQSLMRDLQCEHEHFKDRIIFMSMYNDIVWGEKEIQKDENTIHRQLQNMFENSFAVILVILGAWIRKEMVRNLHRQT